MKECDVLVAGGGVGGVPAAVAAARRGARVILAERYGYLGGMATAGLVNPYMGYWAGDKQLSQGIFEEILVVLNIKILFMLQTVLNRQREKWICCLVVMNLLLIMN